MISNSARRFIEEHIDSLEAMELLVLLMQSPERWWDAAAAAEDLNVSPESTRRLLERFASRNLLAIGVTSAVRYQYQPGHPELQTAGAAFAEAYRTNRLAVLKLVAGRPQRTIAEFADAFRIRK